jgi:hypothetical protein
MLLVKVVCSGMQTYGIDRKRQKGKAKCKLPGYETTQMNFEFVKLTVLAVLYFRPVLLSF